MSYTSSIALAMLGLSGCSYRVGDEKSTFDAKGSVSRTPSAAATKENTATDDAPTEIEDNGDSASKMKDGDTYIKPDTTSSGTKTSEKSVDRNYIHLRSR